MTFGTDSRYNTKRRTLVIAAALIIAVTVAGVAAFLNDRTPEVTNTFTPAEVSCEVNETFNGSIKSNVSITNTGDAEAYIRAKIVVTWQDRDGNVFGTAPGTGDYNMTIASGWTLKSDGFYYWPSPVEPGDDTGVLIASASEIAGKAPEGYHLCVEIMGSAIQAEGTEAADEAW